MIIFGTRQRMTTLDTGQFYCPNCRTQRAYNHKQARPYFSLYFVPVFPVGQGTELIECQTCGTHFTMDVLNVTPPLPKPDLAALINGIERDLASGMPVEYILRNLTAQGLDLDAARAIIDSKLSQQDRRTCQNCGLTYTSTVPVCRECGTALVPPA